MKLSSGANATRSASKPGAIWPLPTSPAICAGPAAIHRAMSSSEWPRSRAWVHTTGSDSWTDEIPPQAAPNSPRSRRLSAGGHGE